MIERVFDSGRILLGKYRVDGVLGRGGMGVVLKVTHLHLGEELAIKVLLPEAAINPDVASRFLREAQSAVRLRGEHVARVSDVGVLPEGLPFMVMEYLRGIDLYGEIARRGMLPPGEAVDYVLQACEALAEAHTHGIVHRDIKPANLFLTTRPDGTPLIKVLDFGISKTPLGLGSMETRTAVVMGTPGYMSPEQMKAAKDVDPRTDIWALGIVLYECLGGRRPFNGESFSAIVLMASTEPPPPLSARVPRGLQAAVLRCLEKDRSARFPNTAALAAALAPFARNQHEATTIVERTSLLLQRPSGASGGIEIAPLVDARADTTFSAAAGAVVSPPVRRGAVIGGATLLGAALLSFSAVKIFAGGGVDAGDRIDHSAITGAILESRATGTPGTVVRSGPSSSHYEPYVAAQKVASCAELASQKRWQELLACASELDGLGGEDSARRFRALGTVEATNAAIDQDVRRALAAKNLKEAEVRLKKMSFDSVYRKPLIALFDDANELKVSEAKGIVQLYLSANDCSGLTAYLSQDVSTAGTERVLAVFNDAVSTCMTRTAATNGKKSK